MNHKSALARGFRLVAAHPALVGGLFIVNLSFGVLAAAAPRFMFAPVLDHSLQSQQLVNDFSLGALIEFIGRPDIALRPLFAQSYVFALLYLVFTLFTSGGITSSYIEDRRLSPAEFFSDSGRYFFRMFRLALLGTIPFGLVLLSTGIVIAASSAVDGNASAPPVSFYVLLSGILLLSIIALFVRAWFDVAQARTVDRDERSMVVTALRIFPFAARHAPALLWAYCRIVITCWAFCAAAMWIWLRLPHGAVLRPFVTLEFALAVSVVMRLWQRATAITCYQRYMPLSGIDVPPQSMEATVLPEDGNAPPEQARNSSLVSAPQPST